MSEKNPIKLSELTQQIQNVLTQSFGDKTYWIIAEISGHKFYPDKDRHYFDLVEKIENSNTETTKIKAKSWEFGSQRIKLFEKETGERLRDGLQVLILVKVEYHSIHGLSLTLRDIDQEFTLGKLERQRRETLNRLICENPEFIQLVNDQYITNNKKSKLNSIIQKIALIGSPKSEGYTDFVHTISNNQYQYKFSVNSYYSAVQGAGAEQELVNTLIKIYHDNATNNYDCVVIIRGGGSKTDFLVFDTYALARAAAKFPIPIITGIGHHKDVSILDLMVHTQTKTPTKAAEFIISNNRSFEESIILFQKAIVIKSQQILSSRIRQINIFNTTIVSKTQKILFANKNFLINSNQTIINKSRKLLIQQEQLLLTFFNRLTSRPSIIVNNRLSELSNLVSNLRSNSNKYLVNQKGYLGHFISIINLMSPVNILKKGFAIITQNDKIVTSGKSLEIGSQIKISMTDIEITSQVLTKNVQDGKHDI